MDYIYSHLRKFFQPLYDLRSYRKAYKNYFEVIHKKRSNNYPFKVILRNEKTLSIKNISHLRVITRVLKNDCSFQDDLIIIKKNGYPEIKLYDWIENGDMRATFFEEQYGWLPVRDKEVIDIGSNIADSSIYFAINGAKKVISIEPSPRNFQSAKKNIEINQLSKKIELMMIGCSNNKGSISVDAEKSGITYSLDNNEKKGTEVPLTTLNEILKGVNKLPCILKMDCEGCEYETILSASRETLRNFSHIQIEYHFGYKNLKKKLENCGFDVKVTRPRIGLKLNQESKRTLYGYIFAKSKS